MTKRITIQLKRTSRKLAFQFSSCFIERRHILNEPIGLLIGNVKNVGRYDTSELKKNYPAFYDKLLFVNHLYTSSFQFMKSVF